MRPCRAPLARRESGLQSGDWLTFDRIQDQAKDKTSRGKVSRKMSCGGGGGEGGGCWEERSSSTQWHVRWQRQQWLGTQCFAWSSDAKGEGARSEPF